MIQTVRNTQIRSAIVAGLLAAGTLAAVAQGSQPVAARAALAQQIDVVLAAPAVARAHWGLKVTAMDGTPIYDAAVTRPAVLVLGSESHGLSASLREMDAQVVSIPRVGSAESLNVAMAAAALCTELARRAR